MRIDAHQHFWEYSPSEYDWIDERMHVLKRDFGPADLKPHLDATGIGGSVAVQARQSVEETEYLLRLADTTESVLGVVGWVDLCSDDAQAQLERFGAHERFVGVRHVVQDEPDDRFLLREDFLRGVALLKEHDLTYDVLIYPSQLPAALEFVERFPDHRLVLDHIAKPPIGRRELEPWAGQVEKLAKHENLYCKVSGMVTETEWHGWKTDDFTPYLDVVFEAFGARRILIGSDWPVCTLSATYLEVMDIVHQYISTLSDADKAAVLGGNAIDFYDLEAPTDADAR